MVSSVDRALFIIPDSVAGAARELGGFYRNDHSCRWVGDLLVLRMQTSPDRRQLDELNTRFADIVVSGQIRSARPFPPERAGHDHLELPRLALRFDRVHYGRLRQLIDAINELVPVGA